MLQLKTTFTIFNLLVFLCIINNAEGQSIKGKIIDVLSKRGIPFVKISDKVLNHEILTDYRGYFATTHGSKIKIHHPFYEEKEFNVNEFDTLIIISLTPKNEIVFNEKQAENGLTILSRHHEFLPITSTTELDSYEFLSFNKLEVFEKSSIDDDWELKTALESIEKNKFKFPDKKYSKVVMARYDDGDSSNIGFIPVNSYSVSEKNEYIFALGIKYYNPLFHGAQNRYEYALVDSIMHGEEMIRIIFFRPKPKKRFIGLTGLLYFSGDHYAHWGGFTIPYDKKIKDFEIAYYQSLTSKNTRFLKDLRVILTLKNIPNYNKITMVKRFATNSHPDFGVLNISNSKWVDMAIFNQRKDTLDDDTWMMTQHINKDKLEYIKKDTVDSKFISSNTLRLAINIYEGRLGYRMKYFDINNLFAINKFEAVRIGFGLQSHENLSNIFTFGAYFGYGFGDNKFKYGANVGVNFGKRRNNLLSFKYTRDLMEPGLVHFMNKKQDLVRDFFTSRMDDYKSGMVSLTTKINSFLSSKIIYNDYSLTPLYDYIFNPFQNEITGPQTFKFSETSLQFNIGTPFSDNHFLRKILYREKLVTSNLYLNVSKGWDNQLDGEFDYWKINGRLISNLKLNQQSVLKVVLDGGVMTKDQPYPIMFGGPGTEFEFTGLVINNAFQTMKLYGFFTDRYAHTFIDYNVGNVFFKKSKFKPELALALNIGWGKLMSNKDYHEDIEVRDYSRGYFETGVMLNNLLRLKIYKYFYGGLGLGAYVGFGPDAERGSFAIRISYELGTL